MSEFRVPLTTIKDVFAHPNATALEFVKCYDYNVIVPKDKYKVGDQVIYVPIDSILPQALADKLFPVGSKIKLNKNRIRQIKIRGLNSQGMIIDLEDLAENSYTILENDYSEILGITKYEPGPAPFESVPGKKRQKPKENPLFHQYNGVENIKWYPELFAEGEEVVIQEKLHGSNCRASILPYAANTPWKKFKKWLGFAPEFEYCYGSNMVQLQERKNYKGWYGENVYGSVLKKVDAFNKIKPGETIYGELIGEGIQKNYSYGHKEHHFVLFDVKILQPDRTQKWLNPDEVYEFAMQRNFDMVPILYKGSFQKEIAQEIIKKPSYYDYATKVMEGVVLKSRFNYNDERMPSNKKALKLINEKYLEKDQSEYH